ncbi:hypothetical protein VTI28DRAFT_1257 [Corynascus sepedonium]
MARMANAIKCKGHGKGHKVERVLLLLPPPHPPHQQPQSSASTSPIGTTNSTLPLLGPQHTAACSINQPRPTAMLFGYGGHLPLNTHDTAYTYYHHHDA